MSPALPHRGCGWVFNDKACAILHYRRAWTGNLMSAFWPFLCGPPSGVSINHIAESIERTCRSAYCLVRWIMDKIRGLPEWILLWAGETDEEYLKAGAKGVPPKDSSDGWTIPSCREAARTGDIFLMCGNPRLEFPCCIHVQAPEMPHPTQDTVS